MTTADAKAALRDQSFLRRAATHGQTDPEPAMQAVLSWIAGKKDVRCISAYAAIRTEIDPRPLMIDLSNQGFTLCLPVVVGRAQPLVFRRWDPETELIKGAFGAPIPPETASELIPDAVIAPLLAFDRRGHRLGYGGGFYDRTLAKLRAAAPVPAIGLAYSVQEVDEVPTDATDIALDAIATEAGLTTL